MAGSSNAVHRGGKVSPVRIDSDKLRKLFAAPEEAEGLTVQEIAAELGMHHDSISRRLKTMIAAGKARCSGVKKIRDSRGRMQPVPDYVFD